MEKFIPKGLYCYELLSIEHGKTYAELKIHTHPCDYYDAKKERCKLLKVDIDDQCSVCNKPSDEEFYKEMEEYWDGKR
jgi:hypothetical protein